MRILAATVSLTVLLPFAAGAAALSKSDENFIMKAAQGGMLEVQEGQAAATSATSPDVKTFAQKMVDGHTANNQELATLASSKGVTVPATLDSRHQKQLDALTRKTGTDFDKAYMKDQSKDHQAMEKLMRNEADNGKDSDLKAFAAKTLPVVQDHMSMVKAIKD